jgi:hypothetical protein|uniref:Uncharacterized protein n=1 Tax=Populus trichocarpa TaxID=3694 RepID=A0A2K1ZLH2_POPTR
MTEWDKEQGIPLSNGTRTSSIAPRSQGPHTIPRDVEARRSNATANAKPAHHPSNPLYAKEWGLVPFESPTKIFHQSPKIGEESQRRWKNCHPSPERQPEPLGHGRPLGGPPLASQGVPPIIDKSSLLTLAGGNITMSRWHTPFKKFNF